MKKILEQRAMILLVSFTFLAYLLKSVSENIYGNVFVTVVNMALLWNAASNKIGKVIVTIAVVAIVFAIIIFIVKGKGTDIILNIISVISISATFYEIKKNQNH
ncbi:hypothetical protein D3Z45_04170 [Lachnospiraceae bacterium]|nr:hypothetical protein [Lachnospiraceae bacterium]